MLSTLTVVWCYFLQASVASSEPNKEVKLEKQQNRVDVLDISIRVVTRHVLKADDKTLEYSATAASLTIKDIQKC